MTAQHLGRMIWRETMTNDVAKAKKFYGELFGWTFEDAPMPEGTYTMVKRGARAIGGMMAMKPGMEMPCYWTSYVSVADVDASCAAAKSNGGSVTWGPVDLEMAGRLAMVMANDGACLSLIKPNGPEEAPPERPGVGEFCWETLSAKSVDDAKSFWTKVVPAWKTFTGPGGMPTFGVAEGPAAQVADVQTAQGPVPAHWLTYVVVEKLEPSTSRVESLGGKTLLPALAIPQVGRIAIVADDQGATIGLFEPGGI